MTVSANVPTTGSYGRLQVALYVLLAVSASYSPLDLAGRLHSPVILPNFIRTKCWRPAPARATHPQEVVC